MEESKFIISWLDSAWQHPVHISVADFSSSFFWHSRELSIFDIYLREDKEGIPLSLQLMRAVLENIHVMGFVAENRNVRVRSFRY